MRSQDRHFHPRFSEIAFEPRPLRFQIRHGPSVRAHLKPDR